MSILTFNKSTIQEFNRIKLAYELERANPELSLIEINKLTHTHLAFKKCGLVVVSDKPIRKRSQNET